MVSKPTSVALSLGSNLGDKEQNLRDAVEYLSKELLQDVDVSSFYRFGPVDCVPHTPTFLNAVVKGKTWYHANDLLTACQEIEVRMGRPRLHGYHESRIIDIDILLFGDLQLNTNTLKIPHPEMTQREFVLKPLSEIAPNWIIKPGNKPVRDYLRRLDKD